MNVVLVAVLLLHPTILFGQTIKQLNEIAIDEELPIGAVATFLTDKIPNLDQSLEYDLVTASSADLDFFSIDHTRHALVMKKRLDYEQICRQATSPTCLIPISIAVSSQDTINVYILPIRVRNIDDHAMTFPVNQTVIEIEENDADWSKKSYALPRAVDDDGDSISYSLHLQNWNPPTGLFEFDEANLRLKPARQFDREEQNLYVLRLVAHNQYQKDLSLDVIIVIKDTNDHAPLCPSDPGLFTIDYRNAQSVYLVNATDLDEGDNGKLEYQLIDRVPGFEIDRFSGQLRFHSNRWIRTNQSKLIVNVADHGQPRRLSTQCTIEVQFPFLFDVNLKSNFGQVNRTDVIIAVQDVNVPLGQLEIIDKHDKSSCLNCSLQLNSSLPELFYLDSRTFELYLNLNSMIVRRILSNYVIAEENLPLSIDVHVWDTINPSLRSTKSISLVLQFHKKKIGRHSKIIFLNINEHLPVNERISGLANHSSHCFDSQVNDLILLDSTETFDMDQDGHLILKKPLNVAHQQQYQLLLKTPTNNRTSQVRPEQRDGKKTTSLFVDESMFDSNSHQCGEFLFNLSCLPILLSIILHLDQQQSLPVVTSIASILCKLRHVTAECHFNRWTQSVDSHSIAVIIFVLCVWFSNRSDRYANTVVVLHSVRPTLLWP